MKGHSLPGIKQRVEALKPGPPQNVKTEKETWKEGLREHSKNLDQEIKALKTGDKLTSNIIASGGHKKRVEDAKNKGGAPMMGAFIDGERVTYEQAKKAQKDPDNKSQVVFTNDDAQRASNEDTKQAIKDGKQKATYKDQSGKEHTNDGFDLKKAQKPIFDKTKDSHKINLDRAAQKRLEDATKQKANKELYNKTKGAEGKGPNVVGHVDDDGYRVGSDHAAFVKNNSKLKLDETGNVDGVEAQYSADADGKASHGDILGFEEAQKKKKLRESDRKWQAYLKRTQNKK